MIVNRDTFIRPDVMGVLDKQPDRHLEKPPALIVEVLSSSNAERDLIAKRALYQSQGVQHYLIADTDARPLMAFCLGADGNYREASLESRDDPRGFLRFCDQFTLQIDRQTAVE